MSTDDLFDQACELLDAGDHHELRALLLAHPKLVNSVDDSGATLLIRLIDYPGNRPNAARSARVLLQAGANVNYRRDNSNGTALAGVLSTNEWDVARVLLEFGANLRSPLGFMKGQVIDLADSLCAQAKESENDVSELVQLVYDYTGIKLPRSKTSRKAK